MNHAARSPDSSGHPKYDGGTPSFFVIIARSRRLFRSPRIARKIAVRLIPSSAASSV